MKKLIALAVLFLLLGGAAALFLFNGRREILGPVKNARIVIKKGERKLLLYDNDVMVRSYPIALGFAPEGDKEKQGDGKTPEGEFYVAVKNPKSKFTLSLGLSYPDVEAAGRGLKAGLISQEQHDDIVQAIRGGKLPPQNTQLGGEIYIHGGGTLTDWTWGCMALGEDDIRELYEVVPAGTKVVIEK